MTGGEQWNDFARAPAPSIILSGNLSRAGNAAKESAWPHSPSDLKITEVIGEIEQPVTKFDAGHIFANVNGFFGQLLRYHRPTSCPRNAEQADERILTFDRVQTDRGLFAISRNSFRPTDGFRPILGRVA